MTIPSMIYREVLALVGNTIPFFPPWDKDQDMKVPLWGMGGELQVKVLHSVSLLSGCVSLEKLLHLSESAAFTG